MQIDMETIHGIKAGIELAVGIVSLAFSVIAVGVGFLLKGQKSIEKKAREGREKLHEKFDKSSNTLTKIVQCHNINHPGQLQGRI